MKLKKLYAAAATTILAGTLGLAQAGAMGVDPAQAAPQAPVSSLDTNGDGKIKQVSLGDSFAAVGSIKEIDRDNLVCANSSDNYPNQLAEMIGADEFVDATCGFAWSLNYSQPQLLSFRPAQGEMVTADTDLVTYTLGGNDENGSGSIAKCFGRWLTGLGPDCSDISKPTVQEQVSKLVERHVANFTDIRKRAPNARIIVMGYPKEASSEVRCLEDGFFTQEDKAYIETALDAYNQSLADAAAQTDAEYVAPPVSNGYCDPLATRLTTGFNPVTSILVNDAVPFHPTKEGHRQMAETIAQAISA